MSSGQLALARTLRALHERAIHAAEGNESVARELSELAASDDGLQESIERMLATLDSAEVGLWSLDLRTNKVWYSREWKRQLGYRAHEVTDALNEWTSRLHPDDLPAVTEQAHSYLAEPKGVYEAEFRMRHRDGSWRWILARGQTLRDEAGNPLHFAGCHLDITDRRARREQTLRERELSEQIVNSLPGVFYLFDKGGRLIRWNKNLERLTGYRREEIEELHPLDLFTGTQRDSIAKCIEQVFEKGEAYAEADLISKEGIARSHYFTGKVIRFDGSRCLIGMGIDISERKRTEVALERSEQRYAQLVNKIEGVVWEADPATLQFTFVSDFAETLSGYPVSQWYEPGFWVDHLHPDDRVEALNACIEHAQRGEGHDLEYRMIAREGRILWLRDLINVETVDGKAHRLRGIIVDVTQRKLAETSRSDLEARLRQTQKMEVLGTLAGGVAHDFNNLLTAIIGNAHVARDDLRNGLPAHESIEEILRAGQRAKDIVRRILTFSRPHEQQLLPLDLVPVVQEALRLLRPSIPAGVELVFSSGQALPIVRADPPQIHQVVLNLVTNAWHALGGRNGRIDVRVDRLIATDARIKATPELRAGEYVCMSVHDTGRGIDPATLPHIFEPFFTTKPAEQGTGFGLPAVCSIVQNHGGAINVDTQLGQGTTINVYFPVTAEPAKKESPQIPAADHLGHGEHILYVDDEEPLVFLTKRFLERHGYRVTGHTSVDEALRAFEENPGAFDLVITDSNMPGTSGLQFAEKLLRICPTADVVLTSGYLRTEDITRARDIGVRDVIQKPNTMDELVPLVQRLLEK